MAYNFNRGVQYMGDISGSDDHDRNTGIDFEENMIKFVADDNETLIITGSQVGVNAFPGSEYALDIPVSESVVRMGRLEMGAWPQSTGYGFIGHSGQDHHGSGKHLKYNVLIGSAGDISLNSVAGQDMYFRIGTVIQAALDSNGFFAIGPNAAHSSYWEPTAQLQVSSSDDQMVFLCHDGQQNPVLAVTGSGRVGIGTATPGHTLDVDGDIAISGSLVHRGDTDTYIQFTDDEIVLYAGGRGFIKCQEDSTDKLMLNYGGLDIDLQVKGENDANLLRTDAANDRVGIGIATPVSTFEFSGSLGAPAIHTFTAGVHTADETCFTILLDASGGHSKASLPAASAVAGRIYNIKRIDSSANQAMVAPNGTDEIDGSNSDLELSNQYQAYTLQSDGASWWIIADRNV